MKPLTDLTRNEIRVGVATLDGWKLVEERNHAYLSGLKFLAKTGICGAYIHDRRDVWYFENDDGDDRVPDYPASYDAILPVIKAWCGEDAKRWNEFLINVHDVVGLSTAPEGHAWFIINATPRELCIALLLTSGGLEQLNEKQSN